MPKKKPGPDFSPMRDVDNPTAAFPIGTLRGGSKRTAAPPPPPKRRKRYFDPEADQGADEDDEYFEEDELPTEVRSPSPGAEVDRDPRVGVDAGRAAATRRATPRPHETTRRRPTQKGDTRALMLSLIGGVAMALMLVGVLVLVLLLG